MKVVMKQEERPKMGGHRKLLYTQEASRQEVGD